MEQKKIGIFLKKLRKENNLTQEELGEKLNVSGRTVSRWETGSNMPDISMLVALSDFYRVSISEIIDGERKCENMNQETRDTAIKIAEYSGTKVKFEKRRLISFLFGIFGIFIMISAFAIFPNNSSWGSIYALIGGIMLTIGIYHQAKCISVKRRSHILSVIGCVIGLFLIFTITDFIAVTQFHQVPRFSYCKAYGENMVEHKTIFYTVIQKNPGTANEKIEIIK